ncbi:MAG: hypothetical protein OXJ63_00160 [Gammaproteobacteria bacterium]|nr:hypothetical protein [Gammaproteobacteria bacterium]
MEPGEIRTHSGRGSRIVRVGTHALKPRSKSTLWQRLSQHRGPARTGGGNHRGSVFRQIVGTALIERDAHDCPSWDDGRSNAKRTVKDREQPLECDVSRVIREMPFLWLPVIDETGPRSLRGYIERNAIALLSNYEKTAIDPPSDSWLGRHCTREKVRESGLWNSNHVNEEYDPAFLVTLGSLVEKMREPP